MITSGRKLLSPSIIREISIYTRKFTGVSYWMKSVSGINDNNNIKYLNNKSGYTNKIKLVSTHSNSSNKGEHKTMAEVKESLRQMMATPKGYSPLPPNRSHLMSLLPKTQEELPPRTMKDSYDSALILLSQDPMLQDKYSTVLGTVRIGRLLEDLDLFAVWLSLKHIENPMSKSSPVTPYTIVTAGVDYISFSEDRPKALDDLKLSGSVVHAGKTSMEVLLTIESFSSGEWKLYIKAVFVMVARNSTNTGGAFINKIVPDGQKETLLFKEAVERKTRRTLEEKSSLLKMPPTPEEQQITHGKFMKTVDLRDPSLHKRVLPNNAVWMETTMVTSALYPQPENDYITNLLIEGKPTQLNKTCTTEEEAVTSKPVWVANYL